MPQAQTPKSGTPKTSRISHRPPIFSPINQYNHHNKKPHIQREKKNNRQNGASAKVSRKEVSWTAAPVVSKFRRTHIPVKLDDTHSLIYHQAIILTRISFLASYTATRIGIFKDIETNDSLKQTPPEGWLLQLQIRRRAPRTRSPSTVLSPEWSRLQEVCSSLAGLIQVS